MEKSIIAKGKINKSSAFTIGAVRDVLFGLSGYRRA